MFTLPPRPPKDYKLEDVSQNQVSAPEHSPVALPRATQPNIGKYCAPVPADDNQPADTSDVTELNPQILEKLMLDARAEWLDRPGKNDFHLHDVCRKYNVEVEPERDVRFQHKPRVFQRPYQCEFDCMENARLTKLYRKMAQEEEEERKTLTGKSEEKKLVVDSCMKYPPFWWKQQAEEIKGRNAAEDTEKMATSVDDSKYLRWQPLQLINKADEHDSCKRREAFAQFRLPFKNEAANWYYKNYPPPNITYGREKLSK